MFGVMSVARRISAAPINPVGTANMMMERMKEQRNCATITR